MLTLATWLDSMPPGCLRELVFRSGNAQADCHRLMAAGVEFDSPPCARPGHPAEAVFYDPDGSGFVLKAGQQAAAGLQARAPRLRNLQLRATPVTSTPIAACRQTVAVTVDKRSPSIAALRDRA